MEIHMIVKTKELKNIFSILSDYSKKSSRANSSKESAMKYTKISGHKGDYFINISSMSSDINVQVKLNTQGVVKKDFENIVNTVNTAELSNELEKKFNTIKLASESEDSGYGIESQWPTIKSDKDSSQKEFPILPQTNNFNSYLSISGDKNLYKSIQRAIKFASSEKREYRKALKHITLKQNNRGWLRLVSADAHTLFYQDFNPINYHGETLNITMEIEAMKLAKKILQSEKISTIEFMVNTVTDHPILESGSTINSIRMGNWLIQSRPIEEKLPEFDTLIVNSRKHVSRVSAGEMIKTIKMLEDKVDKHTNAVRITASENLKLLCGDTVSEIDLSYFVNKANDSVVTGVNLTFLKKMVESFDKQDVLKLEIGEPNEPISFESQKEFNSLGVLMPLLIK